ncbi:MAG: hypothetical protein ACOVN2_07625 [Usitatibacteraceae bacterium]
MAQAQVTITAVDRTQAAINSAMRSMKTLERTAKVTAKAVNFAFGFLTGSVLVSAFGKLTKAAEGTEEGRKAIEKLNMALKDPTIVSSVQTLTSALITGFSKVVEVTARVIENITAISRSSFVKSPDTILKFLASVMGGSGAAASAALVSEMVQGSVAGGKIPGVATAKILILGAGVVGRHALQIAVGMGAHVSIMDRDLDRLRQIDALYGNRVQTLFSDQQSGPRQSDSSPVDEAGIDAASPVFLRILGA